MKYLIELHNPGSGSVKPLETIEAANEDELRHMVLFWSSMDMAVKAKACEPSPASSAATAAPSAPAPTEPGTN